MDEDVGVKVTRLRRRLSVEQSEDAGSPAPSTPNKKRGARLAAKPQLELINENAQVSSPRKTRRKSLATEAEEKPITPSRRTTRIKSNSSIVSETLSVTATESPRAIRAARRHSQAASDNDGPATPVRQTRRTRKDSASSVEALETSTLIKPVPVAEMVIQEEPENEIHKIDNKSKSPPSAAETEELSPNSARKSKRLLEKRNRRSGSYKPDQDSSTVENKSLNICTGNKEAELESQDSTSNKSIKESNDDLSESNMSLLKKMETESNINKLNHNNSTSALDTAANDKGKRIRTESCPKVVISVKDVTTSFSDHELSKKRKGKSSIITSGLNVTDSPNIDKSNTSTTVKNTSHSFLDTSSKRKKKEGDINIEDNSKPSEDSNMMQVLTPKENINSSKNIASEKSDDSDDLAKFFKDMPSNVQITVDIEDSDSNSVGTPNNNIKHLHSEDQCVPEVKHDFHEKMTPNELNGNDNIIVSNEVGIENVPRAEISIPKIICDDFNDSCEPMDIDETIHEEISQKSLEITPQSNKSFNLSKHSVIKETDSSKRKSSISNSGTNTPDSSKNDKRKSSISSSGVNIPDLSKDNKRKTSTSDSGTNTPYLSKNDKRKSSISSSDVNTPDLSRDNKRKTSISNSGIYTPDLSKNYNIKSSVTESIGDTSSHPAKNDKRTFSISSIETDSPDKTKIDNRKSSISNSTADTPDLSKSNTNNKSTLILSQLKDVSSTSDNVKSPKLSTNEVLSKSDIHEKSNKNKKKSKDNISLDDAKGTPKQNSIQKLAMQTSTPITTQQLGIKTNQEGTKKNETKHSKSINETDSSEEGSDDEDSYERSVEKNKHIEDEAEEASDDYESGDSQDEEDRRYEAEHEIVPRGETLTSDDDLSNDTNYEKDSFVVSSDENDYELLFGSGDNLSMSDNELTMSKKSKNKFNKRKLKEQKNASKEMFESRHKLNSSDRKSPTPQSKKSRMRIDSSLLASDEEVDVNPKKRNRMRLDSTLNESGKLDDTNESLNKSNKDKSKQGSALNTNARKLDTNISLKKNKSDSATDEKEITVCKNSTIDNADPLQVLVKQEPKTPQKDMDISVVQFTDREEIENVQVSEGDSIMNQTGTDPLQATMACEDTSDSSENEEILQNYDSVLNELNKDNKTILNKRNVSLNSCNTSKINQVEPIIVELNLTQTKKSSKDKVTKIHVSNSETIKVSNKKQESDNEDSSDSIDLQLLFSEDNCGSDDDQWSQQNKADDSIFIPLKKSPGKTNIRESIDNVSKNVSMSENGTKKKKKNSISEAPLEESQDIFNVSKNVNSSINESGKKKKKKHSISEPAEEEPLNISKNVNVSMNEIKKKKKNSISEPAEDQYQDTLNISKNVNISMNESGKKKKKKHSVSEPAEEETQDTLNISKNVNISMNESGKKKKKKHSVSEPAEEETQDTLNISKNVNISMNESGKKKKKKHSVSEPAEEETQDTVNISKTVNISMNEGGRKKKKKHSVSEPAEEDTQDTWSISKNESEKKKKKHISQSVVEENQVVPDAVDTEPDEKTKKKKKRNIAAEPESDLFFIDTTGTLQDNKETTVAESNPPIIPKRKKKKNKRILEALVNDEDSDGAPDEVPNQSEKAAEIYLQYIESESADGAKKKHKKKKKKSAAASNHSGENIDTENTIALNSKKRKRKISNAENSQEVGDVQESVETGKHNELVGRNKKRKISHNEDTSGSRESENAKKKKNRDVNFKDNPSTSETTETQVKKNKKRKHRDDDGENKQAKVKKDSSFQEVHVPRLPDNILRKLDDKPRKSQPARVIATSNFIVENARQKRAKPSNYLEESIYLNEKSPLTKKQKQHIKKPKVLPFIPTASISDSGYTTNFNINKLSQTTRFEAEPVVFSKETYLQKKYIKRLGTYDRYKKQMHHKMSKF